VILAFDSKIIHHYPFRCQIGIVPSRGYIKGKSKKRSKKGENASVYPHEWIITKKIRMSNPIQSLRKGALEAKQIGKVVPFSVEYGGREEKANVSLVHLILKEHGKNT